MAVSFIGGNRRTKRKPQICCKPVVHDMYTVLWHWLWPFVFLPGRAMCIFRTTYTIVWWRCSLGAGIWCLHLEVDLCVINSARHTYTWVCLFAYGYCYFYFVLFRSFLSFWVCYLCSCLYFYFIWFCIPFTANVYWFEICWWTICIFYRKQQHLLISGDSGQERVGSLFLFRYEYK